jgi:hypothetical protein
MVQVQQVSLSRVGAFDFGMCFGDASFTFSLSQCRGNLYGCLNKRVSQANTWPARCSPSRLGLRRLKATLATSSSSCVRVRSYHVRPPCMY